MSIFRRRKKEIPEPIKKIFEEVDAAIKEAEMRRESIKHQADVIENAVEFFGKESQIDKTVEELSELIQALVKERRARVALEAEQNPELMHDKWQEHKKCLDNVCEEIADVSIMIQQMMCVFDAKEIGKWSDAKVKRLEYLTGGADE